jgi:hypothetical protein
MNNSGVVNVEIGESLAQEITKAFRQSGLFEDWLRVLNDEWVKYGLGISISGESVYLFDRQNKEKTAQYHTLFIDAYREGSKLYNERVKEAKADV